MSTMVFREELEVIINKHSMENGSGTPDFILARFLVGCLEAYDAAVYRRDQWLGGVSPLDEKSSIDLRSTLQDHKRY